MTTDRGMGPSVASAVAHATVRRTLIGLAPTAHTMMPAAQCATLGFTSSGGPVVGLR